MVLDANVEKATALRSVFGEPDGSFLYGGALDARRGADIREPRRRAAAFLARRVCAMQLLAQWRGAAGPDASWDPPPARGCPRSAACAWLS